MGRLVPWGPGIIGGGGGRIIPGKVAMLEVKGGRIPGKSPAVRPGITGKVAELKAFSINSGFCLAFLAMVARRKKKIVGRRRVKQKSNLPAAFSANSSGGIPVMP